MVQRGWLTKHKTKRNGMTWVYHFYRDKPETGKRVENTATIGSVLHFPREKDAWTEVERRYLKPDSAQNRIGRITFRELVENCAAICLRLSRSRESSPLRRAAIRWRIQAA